MDSYSEIKCKVFAVKKGGDQSKMAAKFFTPVNSLNKCRRKIQKKRKKSNIRLIPMLRTKRKHCLQKLQMQIVVHTKIAKTVLSTEVAEDLKEVVVNGKKFEIHTVMKDLRKTYVLLRHIFLY